MTLTRRWRTTTTTSTSSDSNHPNRPLHEPAGLLRWERPDSVADGLRQRDWEIHTARGHDLLGAPDGEQLAFAAEHDWILFTFDDDFLRLANRERVEHRGILFTDQAGERIGDVVKRADAYLERLDDETVEIHYL